MGNPTLFGPHVHQGPGGEGRKDSNTVKSMLLEAVHTTQSKSQNVYLVRAIQNLAALKFWVMKMCRSNTSKWVWKYGPQKTAPPWRAGGAWWPQDSKESLGQFAPLLSQAATGRSLPLVTTNPSHLQFNPDSGLRRHLDFIPSPHLAKFPRVLPSLSDWKLWVIFSKLFTFCFETKTPNECLSYRPCINVLVFASGIWIYKVKHNPKISWEVPRFQNKQSQTLPLEFN